MLTIEDKERFVHSSIRLEFTKETDHIEEMFELFTKCYKFVHEHEDDVLPDAEDYAKWSTFLLFIRNFRVLRVAHHSMLKGYNEVSIAVQRLAFENHLLMFFFMFRPEEAKEWWSGKRIGLRRLKREARKRLSYDEVYAELSKLVHANIETTRFFWKPHGEGMVTWTTDVIPADFYWALQGLLTLGIATLLGIIPTIFGEEFQEEPLVKEIKEFNVSSKRILKDISEKLRAEIEKEG